MSKVRVQQIDHPYIKFSGDVGDDIFYLGKTGYTFRGYSGATVHIENGTIWIYSSCSGITVAVNSIPGEGLVYNVSTNKIDILPDTNENRNSVSVSTNGIKTGSLFIETQLVTLTGSSTHSTGVDITNTPSGDGFISLNLNGLEYEITDNTTGPFFFGTNVSTPLSHEYISSGDILYFNPTEANFELDNGDEIMLKYTNING